MIANGKKADTREGYEPKKSLPEQMKELLKAIKGLHVFIVGVLLSIVLSYLSVAPPTDLPNWPLYTLNAKTWQFFEHWGQHVKPYHIRVMTTALQHVESRALYIISFFDVPDIIEKAGKPMSCGEIKKVVDENSGYHPINMQYFCRILHAAAHFDLLVENSDESYSLTPLSKYLTSDHPKSLKNFVKYFAGDEALVITTALARSVFSGKSGFMEIYRHELLEHMPLDPQFQILYDNGVSSSANLHAPAIIADYPQFGHCKHICDIGGGTGTFLNAVLKYYSNGIKGTNFDLPEVINNAKQTLGMKTQIKLIAGNFTDSLPKFDCDCYVMKDILENWSDDDAARILFNLRGAVRSGSRLVVVERVMHTGSYSEEKFKSMLDLTMMAFNPPHSRLRTKEELSFLLEQTKFAEPVMYSTRAGYAILESTPVD